MTEHIRMALHLRDLCGPALMQDRGVYTLLGELDLHIEATRKAMIMAGIVKECADCALNGEGTCCGVRAGYKCSSVLLLINLLMGRTLSSVPADTHLCYFLTRHGCALKARPVICVNFVCQRLKDVIPHNLLCNVQEIAGQEMDTLFVLEEHIKKNIGIATLSRAHAQFERRT